MKALLKIDHQVTDKIRIWGQPQYKFWNFMTSQSIAIYVIVAALLAYFDGLNFWHFLAIFVLAYIVPVTSQHFIRRHRPNFHKTTGYKMWIETYAFPSAHATMSSAATTAIALLTAFPNVTVAALVILGGAIFAGLIVISRLVVGVHYFADVMCGWLLGFVVASVYVLVVADS